MTPQAGFSIDVREGRVVVSGELDMASAPAMSESILRLAAATGGQVVLDLSEVKRGRSLAFQQRHPRVAKFLSESTLSAAPRPKTISVVLRNDAGWCATTRALANSNP